VNATIALRGLPGDFVQMELIYDPRDDVYHERIGSRILYWLDDLGAIPLNEARSETEGFLFAGARHIEDYRNLVAGLPRLRDLPEDRHPLLRLDSVLQRIERACLYLPAPRTWVLPLDAPLPSDLSFPLFVRTAESSWKKGGHISRVRSVKELEDEAGALRRSLGWDAIILARQWLDLAPAGEGHYGPLPQEVRTWIVDGIPFAWSFHYLNVLPEPAGFPLAENDLRILSQLARKIGSAFRSRLVVADFARGLDGHWWFIEGGPGSSAGTDHEHIFKAVAGRLRGEKSHFKGDRVGGLL
jgi:hypothetical protein